MSNSGQPACIPWDTPETSLVARFERCAAVFSDRPAVLDGRGTWSYARLNRAANRVAHHLLALRGPGSEPVALLFEQGAHFLAGVLGVLKTGKFYVPLDPLFPASRNRYILDDSATALLLTDTQHLSTAASLAGDKVTLLELETCPPAWTEADPSLAVGPETPGLLIYTSGSTGVPKGVLHDHRTLVHNSIRQHDLMAFAPTDRFSMLYSSSVMGTVRDYTNALLNGACLYPFDIRTQGLTRLVDFMEKNRLTFFHTIPSVFRHLGGLLDDKRRLPDLRFIILGGETLLRADFEIFRRHFPPSCRLFTGLGMTETGTIRQNVLTPQSKVTQPVVPLGYALRDVEILLLDDAGNLAGPGQVGEITVRSAYMAIEYWRKPDATRAVFSPAGADGRRLFRTGDLGEQLPDGSILHRGRKDHQIKIRGFRIELQEIETVMLETGLVRDVAVVGHEVRPGERRLVAYCVPQPGEQRQTDNLLQHLSSRLPDHMLPQLFVELESLPLTPNGKVDRKALPEPEFGSLANPGDLPGDDVESALTGIWKDILGLDRIGTGDNFFDLGGDSLQASELIIQIERRFGRQYPLSLLISRPTIRQLAEVLRDPGSGMWPALVAVKAQGSRPPLFVTPGGYGDVLYLRQLAKHVHPEQPIYGIQATELDRQPATPPRMEEIAQQYLREMILIQPGGPYLLAGHSFGGYVAIEIARELLRRGERVALLAMLDTYPPGRRRQASLPERIRIHIDNLRPLEPAQRRQYLRERLDQLILRLDRKRISTGARLADLSPSQRAVTYSRLARYTYDPAPYPGVLVLFQAQERPWYVRWDPMENWPKYVSGQLRIRPVPGRHESILFEPYVHDLAAALEKEIQLVLDRQSTKDPVS